MHRRRFLAALTGTGAAAMFPWELSFAGTTVAQGYRPLEPGAAPFGTMEIRIRMFPGVDAAERERRLTLRAPVMDFLGEIYPSNPQEQELPDELDRLPGNVVHYDVLAGVAAVESTQLMGAFRIERLMWMIHASNADLALMVRLAQGIAERIRAAGVDTLTTARDLRALLPDPAAFGVEVALVDPEDMLFRYRT
ncbi:MAG TPA: hypothetical protein VM450_00655 [Thermomicrobiales bacterium]|nr:hypothetical protein [Thermomicrobiales bacterium]